MLHFGTAVYVAEDYWPLNTCLYVTDFLGNDPRWVYALLDGIDFSGYNSGSAQPSLNRNFLKLIPVALPPVEEQRRIASVLGALDDLIETNRKLTANLAASQLAAFTSAWNGQTRVRLDSVARITMGQSPPGESYNQDGEGTVFYQGVRDFGWRFPSRRVWTTQPTRVAQAGDVLVAVRAPVGELNLATELAALGRGVGGLRANGRQGTLFQALQADPNLWDIHQGTGTVFAAINKAEISALLIPWVADDRVEATLSCIDHAIAGLHDEVADLTRTRDELLPLLMSGRVRVQDIEVVA